MSSQSVTQPLITAEGQTPPEVGHDWEQPVTPSEGLLVDRYQVFKVLGRGGFGVTYLARNVYLPGQPLCVIKHLTPKFTNPTLVEIAKWRFYVEARTLGYLGGHGQIPLLIDYFRRDGEMYLVQEYVPGQTIFEQVREGRCFTESEVEQFLGEMLRLLAHVHSHRLIHRDVKPQNIIRCQIDGRLVLIDFGAVCDREGFHPEDRHNHKALGTPGYAPPEQVAEQPVYASDLYALGMTGIFMLTGQEPLAWNVDLQTGEVQWRQVVNISDRLATILDRLIKVSLTDRYQSTLQALNAIENQRLSSQLRQYLHSKYTTADSSGPAFLPPAVRWAMKVSGQDAPG